MLADTLFTAKNDFFQSFYDAQEVSVPLKSVPSNQGFFVLSGFDNNPYNPMIQVLFRQLLSLDRMRKADKQLVA